MIKQNSLIPVLKFTAIRNFTATSCVFYYFSLPGDTSTITLDCAWAITAIKSTLQNFISLLWRHKPTIDNLTSSFKKVRLARLAVSLRMFLFCVFLTTWTLRKEKAGGADRKRKFGEWFLNSYFYLVTAGKSKKRSSEMDPGGPGDGWAQSPIEYKPEPSTLMQTGDKKGFVVHYVYFKVQLNCDTISKDIGPAMRMGSSKQVQP